jgi:hypothetical protein
MIEVFKARTRLEAWLAATRFLLKRPKHFALNVILDIHEPGATSESDTILRSNLDKLYAAHGNDPLHTTAETIFPGWEYFRTGMSGLTTNYLADFEGMKASASGSWGTYAHRILQRPRLDGSLAAPLDDLIERMKSELAHKQGGTFKARYELDVAASICDSDSKLDSESESDFDIAIHDATVDKRRRRLPCLSHLSFKLVDKTVHLTALYRSHDYRYKVPGNLLGLARLQSSVAQEVSAKLGSLTIVSTYANIEVGAGMADFRTLVAEA